MISFDEAASSDELSPFGRRTMNLSRSQPGNRAEAAHAL